MRRVTLLRSRAVPPATYGFDDVGDQAWLLLDEVRVAAYARAIRAAIKPSDVVADIGTGNGVLAVLAAKAGARKVYAVEAGGIADLATRVFRENGVDGRVELLRGDARDVRFPEPPTVVVSETLGTFGIDENMVALFRVLKPRCAPGVRFIPHTLRMCFAAAWDERLAVDLPRFSDIEGVSFDELRKRLVQRPSARYLLADQLRGPGVCAASIALSAAELPNRYRCALTVDRTCSVNTIGAWFEAVLGDGIVLSTSPELPRTSWINMKFPIVPELTLSPDQRLEVEIEPLLGGGRGLWRWTASVAGEKREGDMLASSGGSLRDFASQLGLNLASGEIFVGSPQLQAWAAILGGDVGPSIDVMAARLLAAQPTRYADLTDAREEVLRLLDAAGALDSKS